MIKATCLGVEKLKKSDNNKEMIKATKQAVVSMTAA